jgi:hypothetical protein
VSERLTTVYEIGDAVEILFGEEWLPGFVVHKQHPGVWVRTSDGRPWFVTNSRRIRQRGSE